MTPFFGCLVTALLTVAPAVREPAAPPAAPLAPDAAPLAELRPLEVRVRRLFLVRPDLMRFPVPYDTVC